MTNESKPSPTTEWIIPLFWWEVVSSIPSVYTWEVQLDCFRKIFFHCIKVKCNLNEGAIPIKCDSMPCVKWVIPLKNSVMNVFPHWEKTKSPWKAWIHPKETKIDMIALLKLKRLLFAPFFFLCLLTSFFGIDFFLLFDFITKSMMVFRHVKVLQFLQLLLFSCVS